jgi:UDP-glucuronate decarboxylase
MQSSPETTGPINLGNPGELTMIELAEKIISLTNSKSELAFKPLPQDDPTQREPDITLARSELDWSPSVTVDDGLARTIAYFDQLLGAGEIAD